MNMYLHGIGAVKVEKTKVAAASRRSSSATNQRQDASATIDRADALAQPSGRKFDLILANPPFGKKGGYTIVGEDGKITTEKQEYERDDFWATTSNKQLNFLQHIVSELAIGGVQRQISQAESIDSKRLTSYPQSKVPPPWPATEVAAPMEGNPTRERIDRRACQGLSAD